mmetsp:Transcript_52539/g.87159  ORF Transcript_52539/g.87159 Transcript_52539/m.87159 type:complete len:224 (-) Transcript_52539:187-858(-)
MRTSSIERALESFASARPPGIYCPAILESLWRRAAGSLPPVSHWKPPQPPMWHKLRARALGLPAVPLFSSAPAAATKAPAAERAVTAAYPQSAASAYPQAAFAACPQAASAYPQGGAKRSSDICWADGAKRQRSQATTASSCPASEVSMSAVSSSSTSGTGRDAKAQVSRMDAHAATCMTNPNQRPDTTGLSACWTVEWSRSNKRWYFFNKKTNTALWEFPKE